MTYIHRFKPIIFGGGPGPATPQRPKGVEFDEHDKVFESKEAFDIWYKGLVAGLAELDEYMNYCKYFVREKGNVGAYEREGKRFYPVDGLWCGLHDFSWEYPGRSFAPAVDFVVWLIENSWEDEWFELMDRYKNL